MFKVRTMCRICWKVATMKERLSSSLCHYCQFWTDFTPCLGVSIVDLLRHLRILWRLSMIWKTSKKGIKKKINVLWFVKVYLYSESSFNTLYIYWDKKNVKKVSFGQNKRYKKCCLFSFASSSSSQFYFLFRDSYMSWHTRFSHSKIVCLGFSIFDLILPLLKIIFCLTKSIDPNTLKRHN